MNAQMESYMQKLAKKKESATITILPVLQTEEHQHSDSCADGSCGCGSGADDGCCGGGGGG